MRWSAAWDWAVFRAWLPSECWMLADTAAVTGERPPVIVTDWRVPDTAAELISLWTTG